MAAKRIWKYELEIADRQTISLPSDAKILSVGNQRGKLCLWAIVSPNKSPVDRTIEIVGTGNPMVVLDDMGREFLGTVSIEPFVWHVFELSYF